MDDGRDVRRVRPAVALRGDVEWRVGILGEAAKEELEEGVHVFAGDRTRVHGGTRVGVGEADVDGLVEEDDVRVLVPGVLVVGYVRPIIRDGARSELKEQAS